MSAAAARTGTARPAARTATRAPRPEARAEQPEQAGARRGSLRIAPPPAPRIARGPFVAAVLAVLAAGLLGLLLLNTVLAQGSFHLHALQVQGKQLADQEQDLQHDVDTLQAPAALAAQAQAQGMVPGGPPVFLRLPDGAVLGDPTPAPAPTAAPVPPAADLPADAQPTAAPSAKTSVQPSAKASAQQSAKPSVKPSATTPKTPKTQTTTPGPGR